MPLKRGQQHSSEGTAYDFEDHKVRTNTGMVEPTPQWMLLTGYGLTGICALFLFMDAGMKLMQLPIVLESTTQIGWQTGSLVPLGIVLLTSTLLYLFPRTSLLGAVLLTGYLGGAVATHARIGSPLLTHTLFGVYIGIMMWGGLYLRDPVLRSVFPLR